MVYSMDQFISLKGINIMVVYEGGERKKSDVSAVITSLSSLYGMTRKAREGRGDCTLKGDIIGCNKGKKLYFIRITM